MVANGPPRCPNPTRIEINHQTDGMVVGNQSPVQSGMPSLKKNRVGYGGVPGEKNKHGWMLCVWWLGENWWPVGAVGLVDRFGNSVPA